MKQTKFIFFDVGGVLILDFSNTNKWAEMKKDLGVTKETNEAFEAVWQKHRDRIGIDCDIDTLIPEFQEKTGIVFPKNYSMLDDFIARFEVNPYIWSVVKKAQKLGKKVGMLTNMYPRMLSSIQKVGLIQDIKWDLIIDSSVVGMQKPNKEIFKLAEQETGLKPEEIMFVDNLLINTKAAEKQGWQTFLYDDQKPEKASKELIKIL
ncbi:HAD-IA family hydrolase [Patescibacteria group bacterium]|nr:HAD-IA family hydrolase [Patescibacteria group bacterium]